MSTKQNEDQDLNWHKSDETEELIKSETPDKKYMEDKNLCVKCHGPKRTCSIPYCPQAFRDE